MRVDMIIFYCKYMKLSGKKSFKKELNLVMKLQV